jgi:hypothetical protein
MAQGPARWLALAAVLIGSLLPPTWSAAAESGVVRDGTIGPGVGVQPAGPAYVITPAGAARLLAEVAPLRSVPLKIGRGVPVVETFGVDGLMNLSYGRMDSWVVNPPLAVALNNPNTSLTKTAHTPAPSNFGH